jgi:hypothetical protein
VLLMAVFLVNLPLVHQTWIDRQLAQSGRVVAASLVDARRASGNYLVDYRLPRSVDAEGTRFSARVDRTSFAKAKESGVLPVRVVPDKPATNQPVGAVSSPVFLVVAVVGDLVLLLVGVVGYRRWRGRSMYVVRSVDGDDVTLDSPRGRLTAVCPPGWAERLRPGRRVSGGLHLAGDHDVVPGSSVGGLEQQHGSSYVVRGRVVDTRAGLVTLELDDRSRLRVETGPHRIRADIRDPTEVRGTLCFTPRGRVPRA